MWDFIGMVLVLICWWAITATSLILSASYALRMYANTIPVAGFQRDVDKLCNKITELPFNDWIAIILFGLGLFISSVVVNIGHTDYTNPADTTIFSLSMYVAEQTASYIPWSLLLLLYPLSIWVISRIYSVKEGTSDET